MATVSLRGTPTDTGGIVAQSSALGRYVHNNLTTIGGSEKAEYTDCADYVRAHSSEGLEPTLRYASSYIETYFGSVSTYVAWMFPTSPSERQPINLDGHWVCQHSGDRRNLAFEVRCFQPLPVPLKGTTPMGEFVIPDELQFKSGALRRLSSRYNIVFIRVISKYAGDKARMYA
ncbi:MAG: hypothetical protein ACRC10_07950 [Thermoguttaceae bacterium]